MLVETDNDLIVKTPKKARKTLLARPTRAAIFGGGIPAPVVALQNAGIDSSNPRKTVRSKLNLYSNLNVMLRHSKHKQSYDNRPTITFAGFTCPAIFGGGVPAPVVDLQYAGQDMSVAGEVETTTLARRYEPSPLNRRGRLFRASAMRRAAWRRNLVPATLDEIASSYRPRNDGAIGMEIITSQRFCNCLPHYVAGTLGLKINFKKKQKLKI